MIRVRDARFITATHEPGRYPDRISPLSGGTQPHPGQAPEIAFAGRSNVGKSTLINALAGRRRLARTSKTPGRTRQLHFYALDTVRGPVVFVDLPGYGYARVSKTEHAAWGRLVERYLEGRRQLRGVIVVTDARRGIEREEVELLGYLHEHDRPAVIAVTKLDKLGRGQRRGVLRAIAERVGVVPVVDVSGDARAGRETLWKQMAVPPIGVFEDAIPSRRC